MPTAVTGGLQLNVTDAFGPFLEAAALGANLDADLTLNEIRALALRFSKQERPLASITASGPFNLAKLEGRINFDLSGIDRQTLNLAGATFGGDFNSTTVSSSNVLEMAQGGKSVTVNGRIDVHKFSLAVKDRAMPTLDLATTYGVTLDQTSKRARVDRLTLDAAQNGTTLLHAMLAKPMPIDWSGAGDAVEESRFDLTVTNLNLADWRAFAADFAPAGRLNLDLGVVSRQAGRKLNVDLRSQLADFSGRLGSNHINAADLKLSFRGDVDDFNRISLTALDARVAHGNQPVLDLSASGQVDSKGMAEDVQSSLDLSLPPLAALLGNPAFQLSSGQLKFNGRLLARNRTTGQTNNALQDGDLTGRLRLDGLSGRLGSCLFDRFETEATCDVSLQNSIAQIKKVNVALKQSGRPGGALDLGGTYDLANTRGHGTLHLTDVNEAVLRGLVGPFLGSNQLESVSVNLNAAANFDRNAESSVKGELRIGNVLLFNPRGASSKTPTTVLVKLDGALKDNLAQLRQCAASIEQGGVNGGQLDASGQFNVKTRTARATLNVTDLNQNVLQPLLASALGAKTLSSASINIRAEAGYDPRGDSGIKGEFEASNLLITAPAGHLPKTPLTIVVKLDGSMRNNLAEIHEFVGYAKQGDLPGGRFDARGNYNLANRAGRLELRLTDLDQTALAPFFDGAFGGRKLETVAISLTATARYDGKGEAATKADLQVANLLVKDPSGTLPATPLSLRLQLDGSLARQVLNLRQCQLTLNETARARNELLFAGTVDATRSNAIAGQLKLSADSLDLTAWYDLFGGKAKSAEPIPDGSAGQQRSSSASKSQSEPAAIRLPVGPFVFQAAIGHLYLRELEVTNFMTTVDIRDNKIRVEPLSASLNDAPVSMRAFANLGVPGYEYTFNFEASRVPLEPIMNSFEIGRRGETRGELTANAAFQGAGVTATSLQKNLSGKTDLTLTNAQLQLTPAGAGNKSTGSLLSGVLSGVLKTVGLVLGVPDLTRAPIEFVDAHTDVSRGTISLRSLLVRNSRCQARTAGTVSLADPFEASRLNDLPVDIALDRGTAVTAGLASPNSQPNAAYVDLPRFVKVGGTLAEAKVHTDVAALGIGAIKRAVGGVVTGLPGSIGGVLGGGSAGTGVAPPTGIPAAGTPGTPPSLTPQTGISPPSTNSIPRKSGLFRLLK